MADQGGWGTNPQFEQNNQFNQGMNNNYNSNYQKNYDTGIGGIDQQPSQYSQQPSQYSQQQNSNPNNLNQQGGFAMPWGNDGQVNMSNMENTFNQVAGLASNPIMHGMVAGKVNEIAKSVPYSNTLNKNNLRYYFHVDNKFVLRKMKLLLFPWLHKDWERIRIGDEGVTNQARTSDFAPPIADINAPDLYLPIMAFLTYFLCLGFLKGTKGTFNPELLSDTATASAITMALEIAVMKGTLYFLGMAQQFNIPWIELAIYATYKYVVIALCLLIGINFGNAVYSGCIVYCSLAMTFFVYKTMDKAIPKPGDTSTGHKRRLYYLLVCGGLTLLAMLFLGFNKDMGESSIFGSSGTTVKSEISSSDEKN